MSKKTRVTTVPTTASPSVGFARFRQKRAITPAPTPTEASWPADVVSSTAAAAAAIVVGVPEMLDRYPSPPLALPLVSVGGSPSLPMPPAPPPPAP